MSALAPVLVKVTAGRYEWSFNGSVYAIESVPGGWQLIDITTEQPVFVSYYATRRQAIAYLGDIVNAVWDAEEDD